LTSAFMILLPGHASGDDHRHHPNTVSFVPLCLGGVRSRILLS